MWQSVTWSRKLRSALKARLRALPDIGKLQDDPGQTREPVLALKDEEADGRDDASVGKTPAKFVMLKITAIKPVQK